MKIKHISLQAGDGRHLRYALQTDDLYDNDPFIILADDKFAHNTFADHPHKGMQTVTYVLEGSLTHYDSKTGGGGRLSEGDFQIMTAGRGIIHNENPDAGEDVRVLQLWVNLSSAHKKEDGNYQDLLKENIPRATFAGGHVDVLAGTIDGVSSPLSLLTPFMYGNVELDKGAAHHFTIPAAYNTYVYMLSGSMTLNGEAIRAYDFVQLDRLTEEQQMHVTATDDARFAFFSGEPIREPIVAQGPFVMNTPEEIQAAFRSYRDGSFLDGKPY